MAQSIELLDIAGVSRFRRMRMASGLADAAADNAQLGTELPYTARNYGDTIRAIHRLNYVYGLALESQLDAYIIYDGSRPLGLATAQDHAPDLNYMRDGKKFREVSYWHRDMEGSTAAIDLGETVLQKLVGNVRTTDTTLWMVTLPEDRIKAMVNTAVGFQPDGEPRRYDIDDGVDVLRQLWTPADHLAASAA